MSHREIAERCHRSEGTVRQHAVSVYRKAGLTSRAEFSAHFLQKLLQPAEALSEKEREEGLTEEQEGAVLASLVPRGHKAAGA